MYLIQSFAQQAFNYQKPSNEILELVYAERAPSVIFGSKKLNLVYLYWPMF